MVVGAGGWVVAVTGLVCPAFGMAAGGAAGVLFIITVGTETGGGVGVGLFRGVVTATVGRASSFCTIVGVTLADRGFIVPLFAWMTLQQMRVSTPQLFGSMFPPPHNFATVQKLGKLHGGMGAVVGVGLGEGEAVGEGVTVTAGVMLKSGNLGILPRAGRVGVGVTIGVAVGVAVAVGTGVAVAVGWTGGRVGVGGLPPRKDNNLPWTIWVENWSKGRKPFRIAVFMTDELSVGR